MEVAIFAISLALLGLVSGSATAVASIRLAQSRRLLATDHDKVKEFEARIGSYRASLMLVRIACVVSSIFAATLLAADLSSMRWWAITIAGVSAAALLTLAESGTTSWAASSPEKFMGRFGILLASLHKLTQPITRRIPLSAEAALSRTFAVASEDDTLLEEAKHLQQLLAASDEDTQIHEDERKMIQAVLALREATVKEIMVPRPDFTAVPAEATLTDLVETVVTSGKSRIPVFEDSMDTIVGVVYAKDIFKEIAVPGSSFDARKLARPPYFVPETKKVSEVLAEFQQRVIHFALVVDEYGGVEGLVSLTDVLEEIVGKIADEYGTPEEGIHFVGPSEAIMNGATALDEVNQVLALNLQGAGFETIGGYVLHHLGRIPRAGERLETETVAAEVVSTAGRRVKRVRVRRLSEEEQAVTANR